MQEKEEKKTQKNSKNEVEIVKTGKPSIYEGFSKKARFRIVALSAFIALINIALAWYSIINMNKYLRFSDKEVKIIESLTKNIQDPTAKVLFSAHALNTQVHIKGITNKQSILLLSVGSGFALMSIGFALFLIGADGAFKIQAEKKTDSKILISGTAPGLLCFLLGAALIFVAATKTYELRIGEFQLSPALNSQGTDSDPNSMPIPKDETMDILRLE